MSGPLFGFSCGSFSMARTAQDFIILGSKNKPLGPAMLMGQGEAGRYILEAHCEGELIASYPIILHIVGHDCEPQPFYAIQVDDFESSLRVLIGKSVDLSFTPRVSS